MKARGITTAQLFGTCNADRSESMGVNEFHRGLSESGFKLTQEESRRLFEVFDNTGGRDDDRVLFAEFDLTVEHGTAKAGKILAARAKDESRRREKREATQNALYGAPPLHDHSKPIMPAGNAEMCLSWLLTELKKKRMSLPELFTLMDNDRSNSVGINELQNGLAQAGLHVRKGEAIRIMKAVDPDGDGILRLDELQDVLEFDSDEEDDEEDEEDEEDEDESSVCPWT